MTTTYIHTTPLDALLRGEEVDLTSLSRDDLEGLAHSLFNVLMAVAQVERAVEKQREPLRFSIE
jgi:hypothetical protein